MIPNKAQQFDHKEHELQLLLFFGLSHSGSYDFLVALGAVSKLQVMVLAVSTSAVLVYGTAVWCHKTIVLASKTAGPADTTAG